MGALAEASHLSDGWAAHNGLEMHNLLSTPAPQSHFPTGTPPNSHTGPIKRLLSPGVNRSATPQNILQQPGLVTLPQNAASPAPPSAAATTASENDKVYLLVAELCNPEAREGALLELSKKREQFDDLALVLWHSFGML